VSGNPVRARHGGEGLLRGRRWLRLDFKLIFEDLLGHFTLEQKVS
jgi:hypothetical protein